MQTEDPVLPSRLLDITSSASDYGTVQYMVYNLLTLCCQTTLACNHQVDAWGARTETSPAELPVRSLAPVQARTGCPIRT